jgi:hypothetical protein
MTERLLITGTSLVCSLGAGPDEALRCLLAGESGLAACALDRFGLSEPVWFADVRQDLKEALGGKGWRNHNRAALMACLAARELQADAGLSGGAWRPEDTGLVMGYNHNLFSPEFEETIKNRNLNLLNPAFFLNISTNAVASQVTIFLKLHAFAMTVTTGFTAGLEALDQAALAAPAPAATAEPTLPQGLDLGMSAEPPQTTLAQPRGRVLPEELSGFWELRGGVRLQDDPHEKAASIGETRLQVQFDKAADRAAVKVVADFLYDPVLNEHRVDLESGDGWLDLRQANLLLRPAPFMDVKLGRQINTWGTGDLLFINDLFPKDWNAYFIGRDDDYLKAPSDAAKVSLFSEVANLDIVYTPRFDSDRYIDGRRIS